MENDRVFKDLKGLVNVYLAEASMKAVGPFEVYKKSAVLIGSWILSYTLLMTLGPVSWILSILLLAVLLMLTCGLEFCIMHDASHQAFSTNRLLNKCALQFTLGVLGGCTFSWHQEHVVRHHGHTNVLGVDPDVYASQVLRLHPEDKKHFWHRWQHLYAIPLYSLMWVHWVFNDLVNAIFNTYGLSKKKLFQFWVLILVGLIPHLILGLVIPYLVFQNMWLVGTVYVLFFMCISLVMAMTFVLAHVSEGQTFYLAHEVEKDWAVHQLETTADFATDNRFLNWLLGGLNFQVEHHIFPTLCHLHYPYVQKIVKKYCLDHGIKYHEEGTLWGAIRCHVAHLRAMSR